MGGNRTPIIDQEQLENGGERWVIGYHRHLWAGGAPYKRIPTRLRRLTVEEAPRSRPSRARCGGQGRLSQQFQQIGNAVPPRLAYHVAIAVRDALGLGAAEYRLG